MKTFYTLCIGWVVVLPLILLTSCTIIPKKESAKELAPINTIGVMPAQPASITNEPVTAKTREQLAAGTATVDTLLTDYFRDHNSVHFISQTEIESLQSVHSGKPLYLAREAGQQLGYDAVLVTEVLRYQTRTGSAYAVDTPASVAFSFKLLAPASGQVLWSADFDQTQQPLFENILQSRTTGAGFRWLTAAELAQAGLSKKLNSCPYLQKK